jgi:hyperosmotically inducible protein
VVRIDGTVKDSAQANAVAEIVKGVPGVASVNNKLAVKRQFDQ